jgi:hypothetical protein
MPPGQQGHELSQQQQQQQPVAAHQTNGHHHPDRLDRSTSNLSAPLNLHSSTAGLGPGSGSLTTTATLSLPPAATANGMVNGQQGPGVVASTASTTIGGTAAGTAGTAGTSSRPGSGVPGVSSPTRYHQSHSSGLTSSTQPLTNAHGTATISNPTSGYAAVTGGLQGGGSVSASGRPMSASQQQQQQQQQGGGAQTGATAGGSMQGAPVGAASMSGAAAAGGAGGGRELSTSLSAPGPRRVTCMVTCNVDWEKEHGGSVKVSEAPAVIGSFMRCVR